MEGESILPSPAVISPTLDVGRAYNATDAAAILGITPYVLNERVREGLDQTDLRDRGPALFRLRPRAAAGLAPEG